MLLHGTVWLKPEPEVTGRWR